MFIRLWTYSLTTTIAHMDYPKHLWLLSVSFLESLGWLHRQGFYFTYAILTLLYSLQLPMWWVLITSTTYFLDIYPPCSLNFTQLHWSFFHCFCTKQFFLLVISSYFLAIHLSDIILWITSLRKSSLTPYTGLNIPPV